MSCLTDGSWNASLCWTQQPERIDSAISLRCPIPCLTQVTSTSNFTLVSISHGSTEVVSKRPELESEAGPVIHERKPSIEQRSDPFLSIAPMYLYRLRCYVT
jgi:hypothetical protein